jgi:sirohydrochlorin ferrochelatase
MQPTLEQCVAQMHAAMSSQQSDEVPLRIDILPFFIAQGGHLRNEVPVMLQTLQASYPQIHFRLLPALGELPSVQDAMARAIGGLIA